MDREFWYLQYSDIKDDAMDEVYREPCAACQGAANITELLKQRWNTGLGQEVLHLCSLCGGTKICIRIKDQPNKYACMECAKCL